MSSPSPEVAPADRSSLVVWVGAALIALSVFAYLVLVDTREDDAHGSGRRHAAVGARPATIALEALGRGESVDTASLAGKVVVLNFWAVWCPPCKDELPLLDDFAYRMRGESDLKILPVVYDQFPDDTKEWLEAAVPRVYKDLGGVSMTSYFDPGAATRASAMLHVGDNVFPTTVILDRKGAIRGVYLGFSPREFRAMEKLVKELLAEKGDAAQSDAAQSDATKT